MKLEAPGFDKNGNPLSTNPVMIKLWQNILRDVRTKYPINSQYVLQMAGAENGTPEEVQILIAQGIYEEQKGEIREQYYKEELDKEKTMSKEYPTEFEKILTMLNLHPGSGGIIVKVWQVPGNPDYYELPFKDAITLGNTVYNRMNVPVQVYSKETPGAVYLDFKVKGQSSATLQPEPLESSAAEHFHGAPFSEPAYREIQADVEQSIKDEEKAIRDYTERLERARRLRPSTSLNKKIMDVYDHIRSEEEQHSKEFKGLLEEL